MEIAFTINGQKYRVNSTNIQIDTSLNSFIRNNAQLTGTKFMCLEGGCGACVVTIKGIHPISKQLQTFSVNSCLWFLFSCHGYDIITIDGIGNRKDGYHPIQKRLNHMGGSQCGYCSPGMIMSMYGLLEGAGSDGLTASQVEGSLSGNLCRCTGYRPILDAFKSLAIDADISLTNACADIEDLQQYCKRTGTICGQAIAGGMCRSQGIPHCVDKEAIIELTFMDDRKWYKVYTIKSLLDILSNSCSSPYMLVAGDTAHGVYRRNSNLKIFIDIMAIQELRSHNIGAVELVIGANVTLSEMIDILNKAARTSGFEYCKRLATHIEKIANVPVRNAGTVAGNLSIKHAHNEFPSDMFLILETVGAVMTYTDALGRKNLESAVAPFLDVDMSKKVLLNVKLRKLNPNIYVFRSYKIMPRAQNAHAYVNAGFLFQFNSNRIVTARICFGGINPKFVHASETEKLLQNKDLYTNETLKSALQSLSNEIEPDWVLPDASPEYRKQLALALFYKFVLNTSPATKIGQRRRSGGEELQRPLSSGTQTFDTDKEKWPLNEPVSKYEGLVQCSGEAKYVNDMPPQRDELWAAFVTAIRVHARVAKIDATEALKIPGVHYFYSAKDIPGKNSFTPRSLFTTEDETIFVGDGEILYYDQPVGIILADTMVLANYAAKRVKIMYMENDTTTYSIYSMAKSFFGSVIGGSAASNTCAAASKNQIIPTLKDAIELNARDRFHDNDPPEVTSDLRTATLEDTGNIRGILQLGAQYHFTMETHSTVCIPAEEGIDVHTSTNWMDFAQIAVAECLGIPENHVNISIRHIGGSYGTKITRGTLIACACAIGCHLTNRPIRFVMTIESNMSTIGKRYATHCEYDVKFDSSGKIQRLNNLYAQDAGCSFNEPVDFFLKNGLPNCYTTDTWTFRSQAIQTDSPSNTFARAPGTMEAIAMTENIMEHIAWSLGQDSLSVRLANIPSDSLIRQMLPGFLDKTEFKQRKIICDQFNAANRWHKRGIAISPMKWPLTSIGGLPAFVAIYHRDGTVVVSHGGTECGQGINTKVAQVAAYTLGIRLDMVSVKPSNNVIGANAITTGGSVTSDLVCLAVKRACDFLVDRLKPIRAELPSNATWPEITEAAHNRFIDLTAKHLATEQEIREYHIYGLTCAEVEIDVLTGNIQLTRVDILEDTGQSISPIVDVGQVEGAFVMGLGYWLTESLVYDRMTGKLLTNRTWNYMPPGAMDIPVDIRTTLWQKTGNPDGVLRSKGTGEPAISMAIAVVFALRQALKSARRDAKLPDEWFHLGSANTPDVIFLAAGNNIADYTL